jgi:hypothetical protein
LESDIPSAFRPAECTLTMFEDLPSPPPPVGKTKKKMAVSAFITFIHFASFTVCSRLHGDNIMVVFF